MKPAIPLLLFAALLATACSPTLGVMPRYGQLDVDGDFGISESGRVTKGSLETAGLEDDDGYLGAVVDFKWGSPHLLLTAQSTTHDGDGSLEAEISDGGITIPAGAAVSSDLDLGVYQALLTFDVLPTETVELGIGLGVSVIDLDGSITEHTTRETISNDQTIPLPVVAVRAEVQFGRIGITGLLSGISAKVDGDDATYADLDLAARWHFFGRRPEGSLVVGYRRIDMDVEYEDDGSEFELDATFEGFYVGIELAF